MYQCNCCHVVIGLTPIEACPSGPMLLCKDSTRMYVFRPVLLPPCFIRPVTLLICLSLYMSDVDV